jgi:RNA polymerase sigma factor for flagellar operon FliA
VERDRFLESHVDLVKYLALRMAGRLPASVDVEDMIHDGIVGLLDAFEKYDPKKGVRFRTYAESRIRGSILDGLRQKDWRPRSIRLMQRDLEATIGKLSSVSGRLAGEEEIAKEMGLDLKTYRNLLQDLNVGPLLSLDELPAAADPPVRSFGDLPDCRFERRELIDSLARELTRLPERERRVMELYYHSELNMKEVGQVLGVTESRVCQLHAQAAARLRTTLRARLRPNPKSGVNRKTASGTGRK